MKTRILFVFSMLIFSLWLIAVTVYSPISIRKSCMDEVDQISDDRSEISVMQADNLYLSCVRRHGLPN